MPSASNGLLVPFLGALQACTSVLLTLGYGVLIRHAGLIGEQTMDEMFGLCVRVFLPALIVTNLGSQLDLENGLNYVPVFVWALVYLLLSLGLVYPISYLLRLPPWVTPACVFNNTTSLPLLLLQSLQSAGSLRPLAAAAAGPDADDDKATEEGLQRAQSYFLVFAVTTKTISYAVGPRLLRDTDDSSTTSSQPTTTDDEEDEPNDDGQPTERTSLLPLAHAKRPRWLRRLRSHLPSAAIDATVMCTLLGVLLGLVPALHRAFFASSDDGGSFNAWLTTSISNMGRLFPSLQVILVGGKLGVSFERMARHMSSGRVPARAVLVVVLIRLILWPAASIALIYPLAKYTPVLRSDPFLWFSMMIMPAGPPALIISGLAELGHVSGLEKMAISKVLTILYALSPMICFAITGALKATDAVMNG